MCSLSAPVFCDVGRSVKDDKRQTYVRTWHPIPYWSQVFSKCHCHSDESKTALFVKNLFERKSHFDAYRIWVTSASSKPDKCVKRTRATFNRMKMFSCNRQKHPVSHPIVQYASIINYCPCSTDSTHHYDKDSRALQYPIGGQHAEALSTVGIVH